MPQQHMVLPHYMGKTCKIHIKTKTTEPITNNIGRKDVFSPHSPPEDIPLLLPREANEPEFCIISNKSRTLNLSDINQTEPRGHFTGSRFPYPQLTSTASTQDTNVFTANHCSENPQSETLIATFLESDDEFRDSRPQAPNQEFQVVSANEVAQVGPRASCHCQVRYNY